MNALTVEVEISEPPTVLYRLFGADDGLLYVGISANLKARFASHAAEKDWWPLVTRRTVQLYGTRDLAEAAESAAILAERPRHNVLGVMGIPGRPLQGLLHHEPAAVTSAREAAGLTRTGLAKQVGCSLTLISQIESGTRNATPPNLLKIARVLNCPIVTLERKRRWAA